MKTSSWKRCAPLAAFVIVTAAASGCRAPDLEVRTFDLEHLEATVAARLIEPYVYGDRPGAAGAISIVEGAVTVRETADNLDQIARVLSEFDRPKPDARLHFQLIEADGFTETDPRIAAVESELRKVLQFQGYRLAGEAVVAISNGSDVSQRLRTPEGIYQITAEVGAASTGTIRVHDVTLWSEDSGQILQTTVNVRPGQTLVLGSSPKEGSTATLLLTLRAEEGGAPE